MALKNLDNVSLTPDKQVGVSVNNKNAQKVKNILGVQTLYIPKVQPGVYCIFFEKDDRVYIGQSSCISRELTRIRARFRSQLAVKQAFERNKPNISFYAIIQGPGCDKKERIKLESFLIQKVGKKCINIEENPYEKKYFFKDDPRIIQPTFIRFTDSWSKFGLSYDNLPFPSSGSCIYLFLHKATGNFYIGQSSLANSNPVLNRHRRNIKNYQRFELSGYSGMKTYQPIVSDVRGFDAEFYYSAIIHSEDIALKDLSMLEKKIRREAAINYPGRLYNPLSKEEEIMLKNYFLRAENLIPARSPKRARTEKLPYLPNSFKYPVIVKGEWFESLKEAFKKTNVPVDTIKGRCLSPQFPDYIWLKDISAKQLPTAKDIQDKIKEFNKKLELACIYYSPEIKKTKKSTFNYFYQQQKSRLNTD